LQRGWTQVTPSDFSWERDALAFLKERLPDHEPYRAWANFEFILDGSIGEVDVFVVSPKGVFLIEIKSWPGELRGDAGTWRRIPPGHTRERSDDNPLLLANRKAKRLKSLLARQPAFRGQQPPFIAPLVFLSHPDLDCRLDLSGRDGVTGLGGDGDGAPLQKGGLPGVIDVIARITPDEHAALGRRRIDKPTAKRIALALEQAGVRPSQRSRKVGDLELRELLDEGPGYQDFAAIHPRSQHTHRRVRIYGTPDSDPLQREQIVRAAQREFELLAPVQHPGIVRALDLREHELGPALVFERDPTEIRLDQYLDQQGASLTLYDRLALVRDLAETVASAHGRRLTHRALSPRSVLVVRPGTPEQRFCIINWQTGARQGGDSLSGTIEGTRHVEQLVDTDTAPYLAPEAITVADADAQLLDVFSLGAIAYLVFTGQPPATSLSALTERLQRDGALEVSAILDGAGEYLSALVRDATAGDANDRTATVADFIDGIALVEEELTAPEEPEGPEEVSPLAAKPGDNVAGFEVVKRLGRGSTAVALLVKDADDQQRVLKIAADPDRNPRVREEGEVLAQLRDRTIIAIHGEPIEAAGHVGLVLSYAAEGTLAHRLHNQGRLSLGDLERWGGDLLSAVSYLEREAIPHRDIKPENLGIIEAGARKQRHLVLMDFSLSRAPADQLHVGTRPYLDPFLSAEFGRRRWDLAGDRFAAAMVLHEMAAGTLPYWGSRNTDPRMTDAEVTVDRDAFPREVAVPLTELLVRALRRDAQDRFDTAEDVERGWTRIFEALDQPPPEQEPDVAAAALRAKATLDTPVVALGLSARAVNALDYESVLTVNDFISLPPLAINSMRGVGVETRRELVDAQRDLRRRLGVVTTTTPPTITTDDLSDRELDALVGRLLPRRTSRNSTEVDAISYLLGLTELPTAGPWPSQTEVAAALGVTRARVGQLLARARERWRKLPAVTTLRDGLVAHVEAMGGVATAAEVERAVLAERSSADVERAQLFARAAVRAGVEVELAEDDARLAQRRSAGGRVLLTSSGEDAAERQRVLDHALRLGSIADEIAGADTLAAPSDVAARLRRLKPPAALSGLSVERLVTLAAAASTSAEVSARLELHPRDLSAARALALGRAALLGGEAITPDEIRRRIAARFPHAHPLPERPALDTLLEQAGFEYRWDADRATYIVPSRPSLTGLTSHQSSLTRMATANVTTVARPSTDPEIVAARAFEQRLLDSQRDGGMLSLMAYPMDLQVAGQELRRFGVTAVDVDDLLVRQLHVAADNRQITDWSIVLAADADDASSVGWRNLSRLVADAMPAIEDVIATTPGTVLLENVGLLARYEQLGIFDRLRSRAMEGAPMRTCWTIVPADDQSDRPSIDGQAIPVLTPNEWARVPRGWLRNLHRADHQGAA
jgi:serine/threonine protein kinase